MSVWVREQLQSAKHTYHEPERDVTWTAINALKHIIFYFVQLFFAGLELFYGYSLAFA